MISPTSLFSILRKHQALLILLLVGLVVSFGALKADFYFDDYIFIVKGDLQSRIQWYTDIFGMRIGDSGPDVESSSQSMLLPMLIFRWNFEHFGPDPRSFHVWNIVFNLILSLLINVTVPRFLSVSKLVLDPRKAAHIGFWSAMLFLVHPLCTEPVYYAKCIYMELVGISAMLSCYFSLRLVETRSYKHFVGLASSLTLAYFSYPYAFPIAIAQSFLIILFLTPAWKAWLKVLKESRPAQVTALITAGYIILRAQAWAHWYQWHVANLDITYTSHILTQSRVFWEYIARMVVPTDLCSDHLVAWSTNWSDSEAVVKFSIIALLVVISCIVAWMKKGRPIAGLALIALLAAVPLLIRWPYVSHEPMVEYRTYPSMAWVALTFALTIGAAANWMVTRPSAKIRNSATLYRILATCVAASFAILSIKRGQTWESFPGLASDVIDRYPLSLRAYSNLQYASNLRGEYQETLNLHKEIIQQYAEIKRRNAIDPLGRLYDITYAERAYLMSEGHCGIAIAGLQGTGPGITYIKNKIRELNASNPELFEEIDEVHAPRITPLIMNLHSLEAAAKIGAPPKPKS